MDIFGVDLEPMILERVSGESLKEVANVNQRWRDYIGNNIHRMRLIACRDLIIQFHKSTGKASSMAKIAGVDGFKFHYQIGLNKCIYLPNEKITFRSLGNTSSQDFVDQLTNYLPEWWTRQVGKIHCYIEGASFCCYLSKLRHLSELWIEPLYSKSSEEKIADTIQVITTSPQVDRFCFESMHGIDQTVVRAIVARSKVHPTEFPRFDLLTVLYFKTFLYLMENVVFTDIEKHEFKVTIGGSMEEWDNWISAYTIEPLLPVSERKKTYSPYKFRYRGMQFHAEVDITGTSHTHLLKYV